MPPRSKAPVYAVKTRGIGELIRAADAAGKETKKLVRDKLRQAAEPVLESARARLQPINATSAAKLGISVRRTGIVSVEQRMKKTTGLHPEYGGLQMRRALVPALDEHQSEIETSLGKAVDEIADHFERS